MPNHSANLNLMTKAILSAGDVLHRDFEEIQRLQSSLEGAGKLTRKALTRANNNLVYELSEGRPHYGILNSVSGETEGNDTTRKWLISPINGLMNFTRGNPNWVVSLGMEYKGETVIGVIYFPCENELFKVTKGDGAYSRHMKLRVAPNQKVDDFVVGFDFGFNKDKLSPQKLFDLVNSFAEIKSTGVPSLDLINLACGRFDATLAPEFDDVEIAPAKLLLKESGGLLAPLSQDGNQSKGLVASGFKGFERIKNLVQDCFA